MMQPDKRNSDFFHRSLLISLLLELTLGLLIPGSVLSLLELSVLRLKLALLLLLLCRLVASGSCGVRPLARAKRFRISVRLTTPERRPDMLAPGIADAEMDGEGLAV